MTADRRSFSVSPPSTTRGQSPGARQQRAPRRSMELHTSTADSGLQLAVTGCHQDSSPVGVGGRRTHLVRTFMVSPKGVVNVENVVRDGEVFDGDEAVKTRSGRAERPTALRHASWGPRSSTPAADHSPRLSPQRVVAAAAAVSAAAICGEIGADLSPRRRRSQPLRSTEYKVLVVGDHGVGKTELICRVVK